MILKEKEGIESVFIAIESGMNFIDVSPYYGHYKAEIILGKALKDILRNSYYLSTKVRRYGKDGMNTWDYSAKRVVESVYESMERLHIDFIDLINVHDIEFADLNQVVSETLPALVELREKGVVGHVGITDLQLENLKWVIDHTPEGTVESVLNFCHYCLCDDKLVDFLDYFESKGIGGYQCLSAFYGFADRTGCSGMASCSGSAGRSMPQGDAALQGEELSDRKTGYAVLREQSAYSYYIIQYGKSSECKKQCCFY